MPAVRVAKVTLRDYMTCYSGYLTNHPNRPYMWVILCLVGYKLDIFELVLPASVAFLSDPRPLNFFNFCF